MEMHVRSFQHPLLAKAGTKPSIRFGEYLKYRIPAFTLGVVLGLLSRLLF